MAFEGCCDMSRAFYDNLTSEQKLESLKGKIDCFIITYLAKYKQEEINSQHFLEEFNDEFQLSKEELQIAKNLGLL